MFSVEESPNPGSLPVPGLIGLSYRYAGGDYSDLGIIYLSGEIEITTVTPTYKELHYTTCLTHVNTMASSDWRSEEYRIVPQPESKIEP